MDQRGNGESLHFQRRAWVLDAVSWLSTQQEQAVLVLAGTSGFGRRRFLDAVAAEATNDDHRVSVWTLDLEGYEPDAADLSAYARFAIDRIHGPRDRRGRVKAEALEELVACAVPSFWAAALITLAIQHETPHAALTEALGDDPAEWLCPPRRRDREALSRWLQWCARDGRAILHVTDRSRLTANQRRWLLAEAALDHRLVIALACGTKAETRRVAPGAVGKPLRFDDTPLTREELAACLDRRFHPNEFPDELLDALHESTQGSPAAIGVRVTDLLANDVIQRTDTELSGTVHGKTTRNTDSAAGTWRLRDETPADTPLADELERSLVAEVIDTLGNHPEVSERLARTLFAATLCGRCVPIDLVLTALVDTADERVAVRSILLAELVRKTTLFSDLARTHPSFPLHDVWCLEPSLKRRALRAAVQAHAAEKSRAPLAKRLVESFETSLTRPSRGAVEMLFTLSRHARDAERQIRYRRQLDWWIGADESDDLVDELERAMGAGEIASDEIWNAADDACRTGTPARALALLAAYRRAPGGMSPENTALHWARCAHLYARLGERERAIAAIDSAREADSERAPGRVDLYVADLARLDGHLRGTAAASMHPRIQRVTRLPNERGRSVEG